MKPDQPIYSAKITRAQQIIQQKAVGTKLPHPTIIHHLHQWWLDAHAGAVQSVTAILIVIATCFSAYVGKRLANVTDAIAKANSDLVDANRALVEESRLMRLSQRRPHIAALIVNKRIPQGPADWGVEILYLVIRNDGQGPAHRITISVDPIHTKYGTVLNDRFLKDGIAYLSAGDERLAYMFEQRRLAEDNVWNNPINVSVSYDIEFEPRETLHYTLSAQEHSQQ